MFLIGIIFLRLKTLTCKTRGKFLLEIKHDIFPFKTKLIPWALVENIDKVLKVRLASLFRPSWGVSPGSSERHCTIKITFFAHLLHRVFVCLKRHVCWVRNTLNFGCLSPSLVVTLSSWTKNFVCLAFFSQVYKLSVHASYGATETGLKYC